MNDRLNIALIALDFLIGHVEKLHHGRDAAHAIRQFRMDVERLATETQQQTVDCSTVAALISDLAMAIGVVLQLSPSIELLAPGLTIQMAAASKNDLRIHWSASGGAASVLMFLSPKSLSEICCFGPTWSNNSTDTGLKPSDQYFSKLHEDAT